MHVLISDLHLGRGDTLDDFLLGYEGNDGLIPDYLRAMDVRFAEFLSTLPVDAHLVLLGDIFDVLQVTGCSGVDRLEMTRKAHPLFFSSLSSFAAQHPVIYVAGNHDAEMLSTMMCDWLAEAVPKIRLNRGLPYLWYESEEDQLYCEHGNQMEKPPEYNVIQRIHRNFVTDPFSEADFPRGSRIVLDSVNRSEKDHPDVDNILGGWFAGMVYLARSVGSSAWENILESYERSATGYFIAADRSVDPADALYESLTGATATESELEDPNAEELYALLQEYTGQTSGARPAKSFGGAAGAIKHFFGANAAWLMNKSRRWMHDVDENASAWVNDPALPSKLLRHPSAGIRFIACGHTHNAKLISNSDGERAYLNTGTWRHVFDPLKGEYHQHLDYAVISNGAVELRRFGLK